VIARDQLIAALPEKHKAASHERIDLKTLSGETCLSPRAADLLHGKQGARPEDLPRRRQHHTPVATFQKLRPNLLFQLSDLLAERGLRDVKLIGGAREMQFFRNREEISDLAQFHLDQTLVGRIAATE
jgi:hypothetical protein